MSPFSGEITPFEIYLARLARKLGGTSKSKTQPNAVYWFNATFPISGSWLLGEQVYTLSLSLERRPDHFNLVEFSIGRENSSGPTNHLLGFELLAHYDKDFTGRPWVLKSARDLQSLLEAYDRLARELGYPVVFGH